MHIWIMSTTNYHKDCKIASVHLAILFTKFSNSCCHLLADSLGDSFAIYPLGFVCLFKYFRLNLLGCRAS